MNIKERLDSLIRRRVEVTVKGFNYKAKIKGILKYKDFDDVYIVEFNDGGSLTFAEQAVTYVNDSGLIEVK